MLDLPAPRRVTRPFRAGLPSVPFSGVDLLNAISAAFAVLSAVAIAPTLTAQDERSPLEVNLEKKLGSAFLTKATWLTDYDAARKAAKESGKPILGYFTRSYAA